MKPHVVTATGLRRRQALDVLYAALPPDARLQRIREVEALAAAGDLDLSRLLLAECNGQPAGALMLSIQDSGVGTIWPPVVSRSNADAKLIEDELLREAVRQLDAADAWIGQALLNPDQTQERESFERNGFQVFAEFILFECDLTAELNSLPSNDPHGPPGRLASMPYHKSHDRLRFAALLDATYRGSLDCPELNGVRSPLQSLTYHENSGDIVPRLWRRYWLDGEDVGLLLSVNRPEQHAREIVYLGVIESARRRGIGRAMLSEAIRSARNDGIKRILIAADVRNTPARQLYESLGFVESCRKVACVRLNAGCKPDTAKIAR